MRLTCWRVATPVLTCGDAVAALAATLIDVALVGEPRHGEAVVLPMVLPALSSGELAGLVGVAKSVIDGKSGGLTNYRQRSKLNQIAT